jgi:phosphatidylserine/phosphatidylglycerophosphate/cardiolipin synthase-like enzyme
LSRSLIVLPDDTVQPVLDAINGAAKSLRIKMANISAPPMWKAMAAASARGVRVRVMLDSNRVTEATQNAEVRRLPGGAGIEIAGGARPFDVTHQKCLVADDQVAIIQSFNWEPANFAGTRDYAVVTRHGGEVGEIVRCFEADWNRQDFEPGELSHLIWRQGYARDRIIDLIDHARHALFFQKERYQDPIVIERLVRVKRRGVGVHVMARPPHTLWNERVMEGVGGLRIMEDAGIPVHKLTRLKLHAPVLMADGARAIVGSIDLTPASLDHSRVLAIEVHHEPILERLRRVMRYDWENSRPLDLTDEGLLNDLEEYETERAGSFALDSKWE